MYSAPIAQGRDGPQVQKSDTACGLGEEKSRGASKEGRCAKTRVFGGREALTGYAVRSPILAAAGLRPATVQEIEVLVHVVGATEDGRNALVELGRLDVEDSLVAGR